MVSHIRESNIELHGIVNAREHMTKKSRAHEIDRIGQDHISDNYTSSVLKRVVPHLLSYAQSQRGVDELLHFSSAPPGS